MHAVKTLADEHRAQIINYLKSTNKRLGLPINFGHYPKVQNERFANQSQQPDLSVNFSDFRGSKNFEKINHGNLSITSNQKNSFPNEFQPPL